MRLSRRQRTYRALLRLFPADFVEVRGWELERLFLDMCAEWEEERGRLGLVFWSSLVWDTGRQALGEWFSQSGDAITAVAGLYGVISYNVSQRTQEISIRMAMGAQKQQVLEEVVRQGMSLVIIGVLAGLALSIAGAGLVSGILVGVSAKEPVVYWGSRRCCWLSRGWQTTCRHVGLQPWIR
ncbi:MAG: hypothetical protein IH968_17350 [Gemmatimonadetes bacterium]|nr:hypothetical protein [Gemmatimonadota bacterium]